MLLPPAALADIERDVELCRELVGYEPRPRDEHYHLLLETIQPMLRSLVQGQTMSAADRELVTDWLCRLGALRGSLG